jgi:methionyl-tRNA formyltransferase
MARIVFMGTSFFAVPILEALINSSHDIICVYTAPPKPSGRSYIETRSPIHMIAENVSIPVHTPSTLKTVEEQESFERLEADISIVAAYGLIIPKQLLDIPLYGFINVHPSALPKWRGAAPIQRTILAGDRETDICIMKMDAGLDTGDIILRAPFAIDEEMTSQELHDATSRISAGMVLQALDLLIENAAIFVPQSEEGVTYANKISRSDEVINWNQPARLVNCQIRALSPKPGAYFHYQNEVIKIITAGYDEDAHHNAQPGTVLDEKLTIACAKGVLKPTLLQRQGRKMLYTDAFLRGYNIPPHATLWHT